MTQYKVVIFMTGECEDTKYLCLIISTMAFACSWSEGTVLRKYGYASVSSISSEVEAYDICGNERMK